jgi:predicted deacylase
MNHTAEENARQILRRLIDLGFVTSESATAPAQSAAVSATKKSDAQS